MTSREDIRDAIKHAVQADEGSRRDANLGAVEYGKLAFQNLLVLQGGALVAVPAFGALFDKLGTGVAAATLGSIFWLLTLGITSAAAGIFFSFFTFAYESDFYNLRVDVSQRTISDDFERRAAEEMRGLAYGSLARLPERAREIEALERKRDRLWRVRQFFRRAAIAAAIISGALTVGGLLKGAMLLSSSA